MISNLVLSDNAKLVLAYINEHSPCTNSEISTGICRSNSTVHLACQRLRKYGYVEYKQRRWRITFSGRMVSL